MNVRGTIAIAATLLLAAGCGGGDEADSGATADSESAQTMPMEGMEDMPGMGNMPGMGTMPGMRAMASGQMMEQMRAHMTAMAGANADSVGAMMPMHRQMLANMIAQMNREMRDMNMSADSQWTATVDSLRNDLRMMPEMTPAEMQAMKEAHHARIGRLMEMHQSMMQRMPM
jgi:hypothetical protein